MAGGAVDTFIDRDVLCYGERDPNGTASGVALEIDPVGPWLVTIPIEHHQIHEGEAFSYWFNVSAATTASGAWYISTSSGVYPHIRITGIATSADKVTIKLYETVTSDSGFSASASPIARNRNVTGSAGYVIKTGSGAIVTTSATELDRHYIGGGTGVGGAKSGSTSAQDEEFVLKPETVYALHYHNGSSGDNVINVRIFSYLEQ